MFALLLFIGLVSGQDQTCVYQGGPRRAYTLNLTSIQYYRLEYESPDWFYYYTPCRNGEVCTQGTATYIGNTVQYKPGINQCGHWLSVDHHDPATYFFGGASWSFQYTDGELCQQTNSPRQTNIWMVCDEFMSGGAYLYDAYEPDHCRYTYTVRTPLACIPQDDQNTNCQWTHYDRTSNTTYMLDLSSQNGTFLRGETSTNGYNHYYSPCQNGLQCYQQTGQGKVMSIVENSVTHTCEHYLAVWQEGRVQPSFHNIDTQVHWSFEYWLSEKCSNGQQGKETVRWYCDATAENTTVINATYDGDCVWEFNAASKYACPDNEHYTTHNGVKFDFSWLDGTRRQQQLIRD